ncbi:hypothetical protein KVR01_010181 [Diaporthe batatas]|uniref:uncharacterized protein n=1 Tax=Diaporthe batatas TaxID=748121 RepID=UPI001D051FEA|nr:uncharacterized protein KVR01_010181 [Diaporthe batatas]KAG8159544.1 hypothetical protein KVR01_010181 [Diaporthe batatas]
MFDVDWSDPNRESVGDRRARKQREKVPSDRASNKDNADKESRKDEQSSQASGSGSVRSSMSSVDKQFGFFGGKNRKKGRVLGNNKSIASSSAGAPTIHEQEQEQEPPEDSNTSDLLAEVSSGMLQGSELVSTEGSHSIISSDRLDGSLSEAVTNNTWNENPPGGSLLGYDMASPKPGLKSTLTQNLGDGVSFITKTTEISSQPRDKKDPDYLVSKVTLSVGTSEHNLKDLATTSTPWQPPPGLTHSLPPVPESTPASHLEDARQLAPMITDLSLSRTTNQISASQTESKLGLKRKPKRPLKAPAIVPACQQHVGNPDLWKAPDAWEYSASEPEVSPIDEAAVPLGSDELNQLALDLASMQREASRMLQASPRAILMRLKARWAEEDLDMALESGLQNYDVDVAVDRALMYKELEMDRKRWMLSALNHMEVDTKPSTAISKPKVKPKVRKILSLFDSQAATSYLAISNTSVPVYHLSPDPLSHRRYPNIHPITCPAISASAVGVATEAFSAVNCLPIASILPSSDLPRLLQNIFRVLAPGGFLNMVIVDPQPNLSSAGPLLRQWLDENLIFNLEQQFRCTNPSRNFPVWLQEAGLRAKGSIITTTRFQAISPLPGGDSGGSGRASGGSGGSDMVVMRELRTIIGQMLWRDVWGPFVGADRWWWEVPTIVDECLRMDTYWEYSVIAACRESEG